MPYNLLDNRSYQIKQTRFEQPGHLALFGMTIMQESENDMVFPEIDLGRYKLLPEYPGVLPEAQEEKGTKEKPEVREKD